MSSLIEVYLEIGKVQTSTEKILICQVPESFGSNDPSESNILKRLQEFSFSAPNPAVKDSDNRRFAAVQYCYVLQECVNVKSADCDITTLNHYVFCLQREDGVTTHCISSLNPYFRSFYKLLSIISTASKEGKESGIEELLNTISKVTSLPTPGNPVSIRSPGMPPVTIEHESPFCLPLMYESDHIAEFYRAFGLLQSLDSSVRRDASTLVQIFAHLLMERRFLVVSNEVRRFTSCCYALQTILYPLEWNYTFVPLLFPDPAIIAMAGLPQPYIMGIHKSFLDEALQIADSSEDCAIVLDVDTGQISSHYGDDVKLLPKEVITLLETRLSNSEMIARKGDYFCRIFMDALVLLIGDYSQFFIPNNATSCVEFSWRKYQENYRPDSDYQRFARDVESKLGMIKQFILSRLELVRSGRQIPFDEFERSLKDRPLLVKECRGNMQRRIKHGAGKLMGTARDGIKKFSGSLIPPRSQSRPILEQSNTGGLSSIANLRRPLSQENISYSSNQHTNSSHNSVKSNDDSDNNRSSEIMSTKSLAETLPTVVVNEPALLSADASSYSHFSSKNIEPSFVSTSHVVAEMVKVDLPLPTRVQKDLICLSSSGESSDEELSTAKHGGERPTSAFAAFDPLEQSKSLQQSKSRSNSSRSNNSNPPVQAQRELIDRVLSLYSVPVSSFSSSQPVALATTMYSMPPTATRQSDFANFGPSTNSMNNNTLAPSAVAASQYRQSTLFPGRMPSYFQQQAVAPSGYYGQLSMRQSSDYKVDSSTTNHHRPAPPTGTTNNTNQNQNQAPPPISLPTKFYISSMSSTMPTSSTLQQASITSPAVKTPPELPPRPPDLSERLKTWTTFD